MSSTEELGKIKKLYGEQFMHLCRTMFPTILEQEGLLLSILESKFAKNSRALGKDITKNLESKFVDYIFNQVQKEVGAEIIVNKTPYELFEEAGYDLYECTSNEDVQSYTKYYREDEELCTFGDPYRIERNYIFWAVKKNVDEIKREDFTEPKREDAYGTSVMSIQFSKKDNSRVSIKNRYNHTVNNPDATYGNNLDRIIPGLQHSFEEVLLERGIIFNSTVNDDIEIPGYTIAKDGKYYKYNLEIDGVFYCPGNVVIRDGKPSQIADLAEGILVDNFFVNLKEGSIKNLADYSDAFMDDISEIRKIEVVKSESEISDKIIKLYFENDKKVVTVGIDKNNQIVEYTNNNVTEINNDFFRYNTALTRLEMPQVKRVGDFFLENNQNLKELELPLVEKVGDSFLEFNEVLQQLKMPQLKSVEDGFCLCNKEIKDIDMLYLEKVGDDFFGENKKISQLNLPQLKKVGNSFLKMNQDIENLDLSQLESVGDDFLNDNLKISQLNLPQLKSVGNNFLKNNGELSEEEILTMWEGTKINPSEDKPRLTQVVLPKLENVGDNFLCFNKSIMQLELPNLGNAGNNFLESNRELKQLYLPKLKKVGNEFLALNHNITQLELPQLESVGHCFMTQINLNEVRLPALKVVGDSFMELNYYLSSIELPVLESVGNDFLRRNEDLMQLELPQLKSMGKNFLANNKELAKKFQDKKLNKEITPRNIAYLDKNTKLTTSEIGNVSNFIENLKENSKEKNK